MPKLKLPRLTGWQRIFVIINAIYCFILVMNHSGGSWLDKHPVWIVPALMLAYVIHFAFFAGLVWLIIFIGKKIIKWIIAGFWSE